MCIRDSTWTMKSRISLHRPVPYGRAHIRTEMTNSMFIKNMLCVQCRHITQDLGFIRGTNTFSSVCIVSIQTLRGRSWSFIASSTNPTPICRCRWERTLPSVNLYERWEFNSVNALRQAETVVTSVIAIILYTKYRSQTGFYSLPGAVKSDCVYKPSSCFLNIWLFPAN